VLSILVVLSKEKHLRRGDGARGGETKKTKRSGQKPPREQTDQGRGASIDSGRKSKDRRVKEGGI